MQQSRTVSYKAILDKISLPLVLFDNQSELLYQNPASRHFFKLKDQAKLRLSDFFQISEEEEAQLWQSMAGHNKFCKSLFAIHDNGDLSPVTLDCQPFEIPMTNKVGALIEVRFEESLQLSSEDFIRLGLYTSHICHESSNPLSVLKIQQERLEKMTNDHKVISPLEVQNRVDTMQKATDRLENCNKELKQLSKWIVDSDLDQIRSLEPDRDMKNH